MSFHVTKKPRLLLLVMQKIGVGTRAPVPSLVVDRVVPDLAGRTKQFRRNGLRGNWIIGMLCGLASLSVACAVRADPEGLLERAARMPISVSGKPDIDRVQRNSQGEVIRLVLDNMHLEPEDFEAIAACRSLEFLSLSGTNVRDRDLKALSPLKVLRSLRLNHSDVGDAGLDQLSRVSSLRTLCLFDVKATPERVSRLLKERGRVLKVGYSPRNPPDCRNAPDS